MSNMQKTIKHFIFCFVSIICTALSSQEKLSVAIPEPIVRGPNITQMNKDVVRSTLTMWIVNSSDYDAVDRNFIDETMKEHGFQREAGLVDTSKITELGKMLNADLVCVIYLTKDGGIINIEAQAIDVKTGRLFNAASELIDDDNRALRMGTEELAKKLLRVRELGSRPAESPAHSAEKPSLNLILKTQTGDKHITPISGERIRTGLFDFRGNFPQTWTSDQMPIFHLTTDRKVIENETVFLLRLDTRVSNRNQLSLRVSDITKKPAGDVIRIPISIRRMESRHYEIKTQLPQANALYALYLVPTDDSQPLLLFDFAILK